MTLQALIDILSNMQMLLPFMMTSAYASLHKQTLHRQWKGLLCIGLFMVRCTYGVALLTSPSASRASPKLAGHAR